MPKCKNCLGRHKLQLITRIESEDIEIVNEDQYYKCPNCGTETPEE